MKTETAERICVKSTWKTCLVPRSDEFESQSQRSKAKVTRDKTGKTATSSLLTVHCKACAIRCKCRAADGTIPWPPGGDGVTRVRSVYVSLALVITNTAL